MAAMIVAALFAPASQAQPIPGQSPQEKARQAEKQAREKDIDRAYKSSIEKIPEAGKSTDPWGNLRSPSTSSATGTK